MIKYLEILEEIFRTSNTSFRVGLREVDNPANTIGSAAIDPEDQVEFARPALEIRTFEIGLVRADPLEEVLSGFHFLRHSGELFTLRSSLLVTAGRRRRRKSSLLFCSFLSFLL
jgi:hypothetical protein